MTNFWQEHRSASFRLQPIQLHQLEAAFLAADLVGPQVSVVGIDRDPENVAWAMKRAVEAGRSNILHGKRV
jgi:hypothetical protein